MVQKSLGFGAYEHAPKREIRDTESVPPLNAGARQSN